MPYSRKANPSGVNGQGPAGAAAGGGVAAGSRCQATDTSGSESRSRGKVAGRRRHVGGSEPALTEIRAGLGTVGGRAL